MSDSTDDAEDRPYIKKVLSDWEKDESKTRFDAALKKAWEEYLAIEHFAPRVSKTQFTAIFRAGFDAKGDK